MTYAVNGLIEASDYNNLAGANPTNVANTMNRVWGVGFGDSGYGQTGIGNVVLGNTITAAQWATLINAINNARKHQSGGSYTNLSAPTTGDTISFINTLQSRITDAYSNRLISPLISGGLPGGYVIQTSLSKTVNVVAGSGLGNDGTAQFQVEFSSVDSARYFFNSGGVIDIDYTSATNNNGTSRSQSLINLIGNWGFRWIWANGSYKNGTGGNVITNATYGYYSIVQNSPQNMDLIYSSGYYSSDFLQFSINGIGGPGSNGGNGHTIIPSMRLFSAADSDACNVSITIRVRILAPDPVYISNSWGSVILV